MTNATRAITLTEFLRARIDEDERDARQRVQMGEDTSGGYKVPTPSRVLAECEAKRRIVAEHSEGAHTDTGKTECDGCVHYWPCPTLRALAAVYADHLSTVTRELHCNRCGGENVVWRAPSPLWNLIMRGGSIGGDPQYRDLVCMPCFITIAEEAGIDGKWKLSMDPEPEGLEKVTPSGRVWSDENWLWLDVDLRTGHKFVPADLTYDPDGLEGS